MECVVARHLIQHIALLYYTLLHLTRVLFMKGDHSLVFEIGPSLTDFSHHPLLISTDKTFTYILKSTDKPILSNNYGHTH